MKLEKWLPMYQQICREFGFDQAEDLRSAKMLAILLSARKVAASARLQVTVPRSVLICGGAVSLADEIAGISRLGYVVAADGATTVLSEAGVNVDMIVSDLDGIIEDQMEWNARGSPVFLHAHGDNQEALKHWVPKFTGRIIGTCQCRPPKGLLNFGGFTDGDRAACICAELGAKTIRLAGFDFDNPSDKAGKKREIKKRKLAWAGKIMEALASEGIRIQPASEG